MIINIKKKIIILVVLVVFLAAAAIIVPHIDINKVETLDDEPITYQVSEFSAAEVTGIVIENDKGMLKLKKDNDIWSATGYEDVVLNQETVDDIVYVLTHITTQRIASKDKSNQALFGLDEPTAIIKTIHANGHVQEYYIGDSAPVIGEYYMTNLATDLTFTVDGAVSYYGTISIDDIKEINSINIPIENLVKFTVDNKKVGESYTIKKLSADNDISLCYWEFTDGFYHDVDSRVLYLGSDGYDYDMINNLCQVAAKEVLSHSNEFFRQVSPDDYILDAILHSSDNTQQGFTLYYYDDESYALTFTNDDWVYTIPQAYITFADVDRFMLSDPNLALISINTVNTVDIDMPNIDTKIDVTPYIKQNADGSNMLDAYGNEVTAVDIYMVETASLPIDDISRQEQMTWFYQDLVTIKIDDTADVIDIAELNKLGTILYSFSSQYMSEYKIEFYEYNMTHYIAVTNENSQFLVNKREISNLDNRYEKLKTGSLDISY